MTKQDHLICKKTLFLRTKFEINQTLVTDAVLVTVGFYVGDKQANNGRLPFAFVGAVAAGAMIISEVESNRNG